MGKKVSLRRQKLGAELGLSRYIFVFSPDIRKIIYTTNAIEALHRQFRKVTKTKAVFPGEQSLMKMLYLATDRV